VARDVYPVVRLTIEYYRLLQKTSQLSLDAVQADLRSKLRVAPANQPIDLLAAVPYLGAQAPLVYWIDEVFSLYSPWSQDWENKVLEQAFYGTHDRAHLFWDQAREAVRRSDKQAVEVFYLALLLGFRGIYRDQPREIQDWREQFETQIGIHDSLAWKDQPPALPVPKTDVPELTAKGRLRVFLAVLAFVGMGLLGTLVFTGGYLLGRM
jgi:type VI secretion system protein ImpK